MKTEKQIIGKIGEDAVCDFLIKKGYKIIIRNYLKKWGELDVVAKFNNIIHFIEVKSVSREIKDQIILESDFDNYRPEDNIHPWKIRRIKNTIETYILENDIDEEWQIDIATVYIDLSNKINKVSFIEDVVF